MVTHLPQPSLAQNLLEGWTLLSSVFGLSGCCSTSWCIPQGDELADHVLDIVLPQLLGCHQFPLGDLLFTPGMSCLAIIFIIAFHTFQLFKPPGNPLAARIFLYAAQVFRLMIHWAREG